MAPSLGLVIALCSKGLLVIHRLIGDIARQTAPADETAIVMITSMWPNNALLFDTGSTALTLENIPPKLSIKRFEVSQTQQDFWNAYSREGDGLMHARTGARLKSIPNIRFYLLTKPSRAAPSRNFGTSVTTSDWVTYFDDDDLMHPERLRYLRTAVAEHPEIEFIVSAASMVKITPAMYENVRKWRDQRFGDHIDPFSISWKDAITHSDLVPQNRCPDAPNTPLAAPALYTGGQDDRYDRYQSFYYHYNPDPPVANIPPPQKALIQLNKTNDSWEIPKRVKRFGDTYLNYHLGSPTLTRDLHTRSPMADYKPDETVFYGWFLMVKECAKIAYFPSELGIYLKPVMWEY